MTNAKDVEFLFREPVYDSFDDAVQSSRESLRTKRAKQDNEKLKMTSIVGYTLHRSAVDLLLSDGRVLKVTLEGDIVSWEFLSQNKPMTHQGNLDDLMELRLSDGKYISWRPTELLNARLGRVGVALGPTETLLHVYVRGCDDLLFCQMVDKATGERLIFCDED